jgi:hypothetical protein
VVVWQNWRKGPCHVIKNLIRDRFLGGGVQLQKICHAWPLRIKCNICRSCKCWNLKKSFKNTLPACFWAYLEYVPCFKKQLSNPVFLTTTIGKSARIIPYGDIFVAKRFVVSRARSPERCFQIILVKNVFYNHYAIGRKVFFTLLWQFLFINKKVAQTNYSPKIEKIKIKYFFGRIFFTLILLCTWQFFS